MSHIYGTQKILRPSPFLRSFFVPASKFENILSLEVPEVYNRYATVICLFLFSILFFLKTEATTLISFPYFRTTSILFFIVLEFVQL